MEFLRKEGAFMRTPNPDIIILDINMPRKNGQEVLAEIKRSEKLKLIPVIMLSSSSAEENTRTSYLNNANCYITKPFTYEKFVEAIKPIESFWLKNVSLPAA